MVQQRGNPLVPRDFSAPARDAASWSTDRSFDRSFDSQFHDPARYSATSPVHPRSLSIEHALKQCVGIDDLQDFCLLAVRRNGEEKTYSSQGLASMRSAVQNVYRQFNPDGLSSLPAFSNDNTSFSEFDGSAPNGRSNRKQSTTSDDSSSGGRRRRHARNGQEDDGDGAMTRKRHRGRYAQFDEEDQPQPIQTINTQQLRIGDEEEVSRFYVNRFKDLQQNACKVMGKVFVKLVEPKKQTHYPYTKGADKCPPWWPPTTGENYVRHREPDHLLKHERIKLLVHILLMIVEPPETQVPAVHKLGLNVKKLEEVTMEAMNNWFNDKEHPANANKRPFLKEIFKVAKQQERYKNGEIDESCKVNVMSHDGLANASDDEPDEGDPYDEAETAAAAGILTPDSTVSPSNPMMQNIQPVSRTLDESSNRGDPNQRWRPLPMRNFQPQTQTFGEQKMDDAQPSSFQPDSYRHKWDMSAPSYPPPPSDPGHQASYQPQPQQQTMYNWQSNSMPMISTSSNGPSPQSFYVTSPHSAGPGGYQLPPPATLPQQNMLPPLSLNHQGGYDGLQNGNRYDTGPAIGTQLRTGSLAHPYSTGREASHHGGFQEFLNDQGMSGYGHNDESMKDDQQQHHIMHPQ